VARRVGQTQEGRQAGGNGAVKWLTVVGAAHNNLKDIDVHIPLGRFVCVTGVSGSGKSSLVNDILREQLARDLNGAEKARPGRHTKITGADHLDKVIDIDQSPIGRTPRSNPATYIKVFDQIRSLYARLPDAKVRGYRPGRFSFNVHTGATGGGRCEACEGNGANRVEMDFLADIWVTCPVCQGHRFSRETLQIHYKGKSVADVLEMDVQQALEHFANVPAIASMLQTLHDVGLDYVKLGQSSTTLSGGEAQRIKLARELVKKATGRTLYLLDEPTTGLHFEDIRRLLAVLHSFVDAGNTVVVIEHNLDVIKTADWVIDLGPEGGEDGGWIVAEGTPEQVAAVAGSYTGQVLRPVLGLEERPPQAKATGGRRRGKTTESGSARQITVTGARQHNLKNVTVALPREKTTVFCGPSGSGKSSLALDTIYTEGQRRYVESLSAYARQFVGQLQKPKVDHITGLSPAISIEQKNTVRSPRSTVGTVTEIYDYMRVLWARVGQAYCPRCQVPIGTQTSDEIIERVLTLPKGTKAMLLAPVERAGTESYGHLLDRVRSSGFLRVRVDGEVRALDEVIDIDRRQRHRIEVVVDRVLIRPTSASRIADSIEQALSVGNGVLLVQVLEDEKAGKRSKRRGAGRDLRFSQLYSCEQCGRSYEELTPHHFSFNSRLGWCPSCEGLGTQLGASPTAIVLHPTRSLLDGAIAGWTKVDADGPLGRLIGALADHLGFEPHRPWNQLSERQRTDLLHGTGDDWIQAGSGGMRFRWRGFFPAIDRATRVSWQYRKRLEELVTDVPCQTCHGGRLRPDAAAVRLEGRTLHEVCALSLAEALSFFEGLRLDRRRRKIAGELLHEITSRLRFLVDVGLDYVTLHRGAATLSGGEAQRIQLASQIGSGLTGVLYVLDEPTIGLHPRDTGRLIAALKHLRNLGNTLLIVEHDRDVIDHGDFVLDFGPGAGSDGGEIVATGTPGRIRTRKTSLTGGYLSGREAIPVPTNRRPVKEPREYQADADREEPADVVPDRWLWILGARQNNLKEIDVAFPLGRFIAVTGVSGSGKSSLVTDILYKALAMRIHRARVVPGGHDRIAGLEHVDKVINVDQSPIGNSPSSNPATYTGVFDLVRELYARLPDAKVRGYTANRFSFNRPGGRCEKCEGMGQVRVEMHFLPDVWVTCENCQGRRFTAETLEVRYKGKSIADVLDMRAAEALEHFARVPKLRRMLQMLDDVGLGYVPLGQPAPTLSGGEAQRVKLAAELGRPQTGKTLYILDEPTTGLHFDDIRKLLRVIHRLVDLGNTVVCIEHNLDVIKTADWIIDLGPEAGDAGGLIVAAGTPEKLARCASSHTGQALRPILEASPHAVREVFDPRKQAAAETELAKPVSLPDSEADARLPWQRDGRSWHLRDRRSHTGKPIEWKSEVLEWLVAVLEGIGGFAPTDWNDRARVEIRAPGSRGPWFFHARTQGRWLLDVTLRVPPGSFDGEALRKKLDIRTLDEREDVPAYGQWPRVDVVSSGPEYEDVRLHLHDMKDVKKAAMTKVLKQAAAAYFRMIEQLRSDPAAAEPWKADGQAWHLSQQGIRATGRVAWQPTALVELLGRLKKLAPRIEADWSQKTAVMLRHPRVECRLGRIVTNQAQGLRVEFQTPTGAVTPTQIEQLGRRPEIRNHRGMDWVSFWMKRTGDVDAGPLGLVVRASLELAGGEGAANGK
jgi:excinuclease ABC subunit A